MQVIVGREIEAVGLDAGTDALLCRILTIDNPKYQKNIQMGIPVFGVPRQIQMFGRGKGGRLLIPRGFLPQLKQYIQDDIEFVDDRHMCESIQYESAITLRDYQKPSIDMALKFKSGVIVMPCGAGKTQAGLEMIARIGQPTLWITHTNDLLHQSMDRARKCLNLEVPQLGVIQGPRMDIGTHITFATVQTLAKRPLWEIVKRFGCIVVDEAHHTVKDEKAVGQFYSVISQFPARYRIGLTASEHRSDGLIDTMYLTIGPRICEVTQETLNETGNIMTPIVEHVLTDFEYEPDPDDDHTNFGKLLAAIAVDAQRNSLVISTVVSSIEGNHGLLLGDSLAHLDVLKIILEAEGVTCRQIDGGTAKKERAAALEMMRSGELQLLLATYQLAKEGLDIPCLNRLYMTTPKRDKVVTQQSVGRIMRPAPGKTSPRVFDFVDHNVPTCMSQAKDRARVYKSLGCSVEPFSFRKAHRT